MFQLWTGSGKMLEIPLYNLWFYQFSVIFTSFVFCRQIVSAIRGLVHESWVVNLGLLPGYRHHSIVCQCCFSVCMPDRWSVHYDWFLRSRVGLPGHGTFWCHWCTEKDRGNNRTCVTPLQAIFNLSRTNVSFVEISTVLEPSSFLSLIHPVPVFAMLKCCSLSPTICSWGQNEHWIQGPGVVWGIVQKSIMQVLKVTSPEL